MERLQKVDPPKMSHKQKLAFWINIYNTLLMHVSWSSSPPWVVLVPEINCCVRKEKKSVGGDIATSSDNDFGVNFGPNDFPGLSCIWHSRK